MSSSVIRIPRLRVMRSTVLAVLAATALVVMSVGASVPASAATALTPSSFQGVNWADPGDNFQLGPVVPSGLSTSDTYTQVYQKATNILKGFQAFGANTVRLPVNIGSVLSTYPAAPSCQQKSSTWWSSYQGAIDAAIALNMKVILAYWEGQSNSNTGCTNNANSGQVYNTTTWQSMWSTIVAKYGSSSLVYFEPFNEPWGYSASQWISLAAQWLANNPSVSASRVLIDGTGYAGNVTAEGASSNLNGTYLVLHYYGSNGNESYAQRVSDVTGDIGSYANRTVMDEFGAPMTTYPGEGVTGSLNYDGPNNATGSADENNYIAYLQALTDTAHNLGIGAVYWIGLKTGDPYSLTTVSGSGTALSLTVVDQSGIDRLRYAWGQGSPAQGSSGGGTTSYVLTNRNSNLAMDVSSASTANGALIDQWTPNGGANQEWQFGSASTSGYYTLISTNSGKCLDVPSSSTSTGVQLDQWTCSSGTNQQWKQISIDSTHYELQALNSGLCADVSGASTSAGAKVIQWTCTGATNQQWSN
jgi:Ricin-type beta-trefoil lectin domain